MARMGDTSSYVDDVVAQMEGSDYIEDIDEGHISSNGATLYFKYDSDQYLLKITHLGDTTIHGIESDGGEIEEIRIDADAAHEVPGSIEHYLE
jgi:hypothetical protein